MGLLAALPGDVSAGLFQTLLASSCDGILDVGNGMVQNLVGRWRG